MAHVCYPPIPRRRCGAILAAVELDVALTDLILEAQGAAGLSFAQFRRPNVPLTNNYSFFVLRSPFSYLSFYGYFFSYHFLFDLAGLYILRILHFPLSPVQVTREKKLWGNAHEITLLRPNFTFFTWHKCQ